MITLRQRLNRIRWYASVITASNPRFWSFVIVLFFSTFIVILPIMCNDWAYSLYMSKSAWGLRRLTERAMDLNGNYSHSARDYLKHMSMNTLEFYKSQMKLPEVDIAVPVITIKRTLGPKPLGYLTQVMTGLHQAFVKDNSFIGTALFICNAFAGPGPHSEADTLGNYFPVKTRFPNGSISATIMDRFEKEKEDYMYCLQQAMKTNPKYVLMVEDDAVPHPDVLPVLSHILLKMETRYGSTPWAYLKLYYPERWQGYAREPQRLLELMGLGLIGGSIFVLILLVFCNNPRRLNKTSLQRKAYVFGAVYLMLSAVAVGRPYLLELRRVSKYLYTLSPAPDCCSPSILYPAQSIPRILEHLNKTKCYHDNGIDLVLDAFVHQTGLRRHLVEPNLFKHIGLVSTIKGLSQSPEQFIYR